MKQNINWGDNSMIGKTYHDLTILTIGSTIKNGARELICSCVCGNRTKILNYNWGKKIKSCGCLNIKTRFKHGRINTPLYTIWFGIKTRINNKKCKDYKNYGGRGITYDPRWDNFLEFEKDMHFKYVYAKKKYRNEITKSNMLTIERKDVNGNYYKDNCCFIPKGEQNYNKRNSKR